MFLGLAIAAKQIPGASGACRAVCAPLAPIAAASSPARASDAPAAFPAPSRSARPSPLLSLASDAPNGARRAAARGAGGDYAPSRYMGRSPLLSRMGAPLVWLRLRFYSTSQAANPSKTGRFPGKDNALPCAWLLAWAWPFKRWLEHKTLSLSIKRKLEHTRGFLDPSRLFGPWK